MLFGTMTTGVFAAENGASKNTSADKFTPKVTYQVTVTDAERAKIHAAVDNLSGYVGDMVVGDKSYDPNTLIGGLATGSSYNSISYGSKNAGSVPSQYPFTVPSTEKNNNEGDRKPRSLPGSRSLPRTSVSRSCSVRTTSMFMLRLAIPTRLKWSWRSAISTPPLSPTTPRAT